MRYDRPSQRAVFAREAGRAADAVHDAGAENVGRVHVAVDVGLDQLVHGAALGAQCARIFSAHMFEVY